MAILFLPIRMQYSIFVKRLYPVHIDPRDVLVRLELASDHLSQLFARFLPS
jgi:hypothetical protein